MNIIVILLAGNLFFVYNGFVRDFLICPPVDNSSKLFFFLSEPFCSMAGRGFSHSRCEFPSLEDALRAARVILIASLDTVTGPCHTIHLDMSSTGTDLA
jgi:hypothetical protein